MISADGRPNPQTINTRRACGTDGIEDGIYNLSGYPHPV